MVVATRTKVRWLFLETAPGIGGRPTERLIEKEEMVNPDSDDRHQNYEAENEKRFAKKIATQMLEFVRGHEAQELVLAADPRMLGFLRDEMHHLHMGNLNIHEVGADLSGFAAAELFTYLIEKDLLPIDAPTSPLRGEPVE